MLQTLFPAPIRECRALDPGYADHASDVWLVRTDAEEAVVRASRLAGEPDNEFWWGLRALFGLDPRRVFDLQAVNGYLADLSSIPVPRVLRTGVVGGRPHVVLERMEGGTLRSFADLPTDALEDLGRALARIHSRAFPWCGSPGPALRYPPAEFHGRLAESMLGLVRRAYRGDPAITALAPVMAAAAAALPAPGAGALVMADMDPTQFLTDGRRLTALVDTEAYVIAPRELDLIGLEYVLDARTAQAVARGYREVTTLPDLSGVRPAYRFFCRLIQLQGDVPLDRWLNWPSLF